MHRSFIITEEERNRILGIHEEATKRQYLNEQTSNITCEAVKKFFASPSSTPWKKFGCIPHHPNSMPKKEASGFVFIINNVTYKSDGTTVDANGTTGTYACDKDNPIFKKVIPRCWENFKCVPQHPKASLRVLTTSGGVSYYIGDDSYFSNGRKYDGKLDSMTAYTCNDPVFKIKTGGTGGGKPCAKSGDEILNKTAMLYKGCKGGAVKLLQDYLVEMGKLTQQQVTSNFDDATYKAVRQYQTENKPLKADGIVGEKTWRKIIQSQLVSMQTTGPNTVTQNQETSNLDINMSTQNTSGNQGGGRLQAMTQIAGMSGANTANNMQPF